MNKESDFNLYHFIVINGAGQIIINKPIIPLAIIQLNPHFFKSIASIASKNFSQKCNNNNLYNASYKSSSNINLAPTAKFNPKLNVTLNVEKRMSGIDDLKDGSEIHPFTFQQSHVINQATLTSNIHKLNIRMTERNENSSEYRVEANSTIDDNLSSKRFFEVTISSYKISFMNFNGLTLVCVFNDSIISKMCKLILLHLYISFMNSNFSDSAKNGLTQMTKEDIIKTKIYEVIWFKLVISNFSINLTKLIYSQHKGYNSYDLSNYYLISINRLHKYTVTEPSSFNYNKNNYCVLLDIKQFTNRTTIDYLKNDLIMKELAFQGELLKNLFIKESGNIRDVYLDLSKQVNRELYIN